MQNGIGNADTLRPGLAGRSVLGGVVGFNVVCPSPGVFRQATSGPLAIEHAPDARLERLAHDLRSAGLEVEVTNDIRAVQWAKLVMNLNNAVSALSGAPTVDLVFVAGYRKIVRALISEALDVMRAAGIAPARLGPIPVTWFPKLLGLPTPVLRAVARVQVKIDPSARSSMWEDLSRGRLTEVDYLNGEVVKLGNAHGAEAPLNRRIVELIHNVERAGKGSPELSPDAFWQALTT